MENIKMLYYDKIEGIDLIKKRASKKCDICHYWYFLNKGFKLVSKIEAINLIQNINLT